MSSVAEEKAAELKMTEMGQNGAILLTGTDAVSGNFRKIQALTATVFNTLTSNYTTNGTATASVASDFGTLAAGHSIYGKFTAVKLTSGIAILYK